ncbi:MAG: hypothetical protein CL610_30140 [Anaerolineaceae bacterium]|nr:hypothetical protein [Anaerolineaceae bacterium]
MKRSTILLIVILIGALTMNAVFAQDDDPDLTINSINPTEVTTGESVSLTVSGAGFTDSAQVVVNGVGPVATSRVDEATLTAALPNSLAPGVYAIRVETSEQNATLPDALTVIAQATEEPAPEPTATPIPTVTITRSEPNRATAGQVVTISVLGTNFTPDTIVRVTGVGLLPTTFINDGALTGTLPETARPGDYNVEVIDPVRGTFRSPNKLRIVAPPEPTSPPPPTRTPIPVANEPSLVLNNITAQPNVVGPGGTVRLSFVVYNRGTSTARNIRIALTSGSSFVPAVGQANLNLPDLAPGGSATSFLSVTAASDIGRGPTLIPMTITYQDIEGTPYEGAAEVGVTVEITAQQPQLVLQQYSIEPATAIPGQQVLVSATLANMGTKPATQILLRVTGGENVLLPDTRGDSFSYGNLQPGESHTVNLPLIVNTAAEEGPQLQPITISYLQDGEPKEAASSLTIHILEVDEPEPLMLLSRYSTGRDEDLRPGTRFTLETVISNVGSADANDVLVTFGTVQTSGGGDDESGSTNGGGSTTTPSTTFAPQGSGGRLFAGLIAAGGELTIHQDFIVSGSVTSGIYTLPVTLQYTAADNEAQQDILNVSLVVIAPARLRINGPEPLPEMANAGEPIPFSWELVNYGSKSLDLTSATIEATNAEVLDGAAIPLETLAADGDTTINAAVMPLEEGETVVTLTINYLDDLTQPQSIVQTYTIAISEPPPPFEEPEMPPVIEEPVEEEDPNWLGRGIMALLGLGS